MVRYNLWTDSHLKQCFSTRRLTHFFTGLPEKILIGKTAPLGYNEQIFQSKMMI